MNLVEQFSAEVAPSLVLLDVAGRRNSVLTAERAMAAIVVADGLQALGGAARQATVGSADFGEDDDMEPAILLYYRSHGGRPTKGEIARAAKVIWRSEIRDPASPLADGGALYVTGSRALVHAETAGVKNGAVVFVVSRTVWYNANRCTVGFPSGKDQVEIFLADINARLTEGSVSVAR
ncbi:hypothetical protein LAZ40_02365 [Cereibacter sphaeroides]|uniref:hypothetical protein n=1 Tax=Cereibacter sphaeroides TaxID=1063 RepID=UPI001F1CA843|nr:hypothetical protein [Cereibacter sphaeroides]MCE6957902.1 hypothetical protein [Cereibacter sphaeroides]MCE6971750.1 hypothetical protein [Cereibacter sphaeroides]